MVLVERTFLRIDPELSKIFIKTKEYFMYPKNLKGIFKNNKLIPALLLPEKGVLE